MSVAWHRVESHASPKGHELRARARGQEWRAFQTRDGRWQVGPVGLPQQAKTCKSLADARTYAERGVLCNPRDPSEDNPQGVHMSTAVANPRRSRNVKEHVACGDLSAKKCRQLQHVYTSARKRGYSKTRAAQQAWGAVERSRNPEEVPMAVKKMLSASETNPRRRRSRKMRRRRNPAKGHSGLGAFLGSVVGVALGEIVDNNPIAYVGGIVGGGVGGHMGAASDRKKRGTWGGALGGALFGPLGAALGGYIGGRHPDGH
jgi:hypothetical protein